MTFSYDDGQIHDRRLVEIFNRFGLNAEFLGDRIALEGKTDRIIRGCSYAFGEYDDHVVNTLKSLGFAYSRTVESTGSFRLPADFMRWTPTCHHNDAFDGMAERFLNTPEFQKIPLLYVWGHSFEFHREQTWKQMTDFCQEISGHENVWYTTNIDYVNYMNAAKNLVFNAECTRVENLSKIQIYAIIDGERRIL